MYQVVKRALISLLLVLWLSSLLKHFWIKPNWDYEVQRVTGFEFRIKWDF